MMDRPNFVVIVTDQQCADWLSCAGHPVLRTPNIDRIAARGIRFTEFHTAAPVCMPNRASILTGRYPSIHGLKYNGCALSPRARTFVEMLRDGGYATAAIGKSHLQPFTSIDHPRLSNPDPSAPVLEAWKDDFSGLDLEEPAQYEPADVLPFPKPYYGYDHVDMVSNHGDRAGGHYLQWLRKQTPDWAQLRDPEDQFLHNYTCPQAKRTRLPEELYPTRYIEDRTCEWLANRSPADADPFFLFVSFPDPHHPFNPPGRYWDMYHPDEFTLETPYAAFENPPPPLQFAHDLAARGETPPTPQEAFAASDEHCRQAMALTAGMIAMIDDAVGRILDTLEAQGLAENTVVIFTSDHGDYLGDGNLLLKGPWMRSSIHHVPFIWSDSTLEQGTETSLIGSSLDIGLDDPRPCRRSALFRHPGPRYSGRPAVRGRARRPADRIQRQRSPSGAAQGGAGADDPDEDPSPDALPGRGLGRTLRFKRPTRRTCAISGTIRAPARRSPFCWKCWRQKWSAPWMRARAPSDARKIPRGAVRATMPRLDRRSASDLSASGPGKCGGRPAASR